MLDGREMHILCIFLRLTADRSPKLRRTPLAQGLPLWFARAASRPDSRDTWCRGDPRQRCFLMFFLPRFRPFPQP